MVQHAPRITRAYDDIKVTLQRLFDRTERVIVCGHAPDEGCARDHVHIAMWNCEVKADRFKQIFNEHHKEKLNGNADWSFEHKDFPGGLPEWEDIPIINGVAMPDNARQHSIYKYLRYCIKGDIEHVKYKKGIPEDLIKAAAEDWLKQKEKTPDVIHIEHVKKVEPPITQKLICEATESWLIYKKECKEKGDLVNEQELKVFVCNAYRKHGKGINPYQVRDIAWAVLYDDEEWRGHILKKISI